MMLMHRSDVLTQHRRPNREENNEEMLLRTVKRSKLKRHLYGTITNEDLARKIREADEWKFQLCNRETGEETDIDVHDVEPTEVVF